MAYARHWGMTLFTFLKGQYMGQDAYGNKYYQERFIFENKRTKRRWVIYKERLEASQVCPEWFGWLHHYHDIPLEEVLKKEWQKSYKHNMTGTLKAYRPENHPLKLGNLKSDQKAYDPWQP